jgi:transcriptional regulator with XRE-family HTH domain
MITRQLATLLGMARMGPTRTRDSEGFAANLLRLARAKTGVSQAQMAALAAVPRSTVERIEAGTRQPSLPTLSRLLAAVDLDMRIRLEDYDDHDDVLDTNYAAMPPQQRAATDARHEAMIALADASRASQR